MFCDVLGCSAARKECAAGPVGRGVPFPTPALELLIPLEEDMLLIEILVEVFGA